MSVIGKLIRRGVDFFDCRNNKQNKVPLKREGVDPEKVQGGDEIVWAQGDSYVPFTRQDWANLSAGKAKL